MLRALLCVFMLSIVPLAGAEWRGVGGLEPDTQRDRADGLMFAEADASADSHIRQVHFQAFVAAPETSLNPNLALIGSRILPAPSLHHRAVLGVWKDCNGDGYIGLAESALMDYSAALLSDTDACPPISGGSAPAYNADGWVSELLSIGMVDPCEYSSEPSVRAACGVDAFAPNERVYYANGTHVWGDLGLPGTIPETECILAPLPSGTTSGSGALIGWADCQSRRGIAQAVNDIDAFFGGGLGLRFEDPQHPEDSQSNLNQRFPVTPFGHGGEAGLLQDDTNEESVSVWDCAEEPFFELKDPNGYREVAVTDPTGQLHAERFPLVIVYALTGVGFADEDQNAATPGVFRAALTDQEGTYATFPSVDGEVRDVGASWWVALEKGVDGPAGDCDSSTPSPLAAAYVGHMIESDATPILEARKDRTSFTFTFFDGHRGIHPRLDPFLGPTAPSDGGTLFLDHGRGGDGPMWSATAPSDQDPVLVNRDDLSPKGAVYYTYYAKLGDDALLFKLPSDQARTYGEENCADQDVGERLGWLCDPALWWRDASGRDNTPRYALGQRIGRVPGDTYNLRDIDCYDGELARGTGIYASSVYAVDAGPCV